MLYFKETAENTETLKLLYTYTTFHIDHTEVAVSKKLFDLAQYCETLDSVTLYKQPLIDNTNLLFIEHNLVSCIKIVTFKFPLHAIFSLHKVENIISHHYHTFN